jgi:integrase/recombinase XerD
MKISCTLKGVPDQQGRRTVYIRLADKNKRKFINTGLRVTKSDFDRSSGRIKSSHPQYEKFNKRIRELLLAAESFEKAAPIIYFKDYVTRCFNEWDKIKKPATFKQMRSELKKFTDFAGDLPLNKITHELLSKYQIYIYALPTTGSVNTVWKSMKFLRVILRKAKTEDLIDKNPFDIFKMPQFKSPPKTFLTREQVDEIDNFCQDEFCPQELKVAGTWFVIGCFTGLRYSDQYAFNKSQIKDNRLIIHTVKTGTPVSIKLNPKLKELLKRVDYKPVPYTNTHYNRLLKIIGSALNFQDSLNVHLSRHTFATLCASAGISQEVTAKLLGVTSLKTVAVYYKLTGKRIDDEVERIFT